MFFRRFGYRFSVILLCASIFGGQASLAEAAKRVALLIGNQDYRSVAELNNPANDVELMRATLLSAGFDNVEVAHDLDLASMRKALRNFEDMAEGSDVAVLYYSGHGLEMNGQNYLIPVDAVLQTDKDVEDETVPLDRAERSLAGAAKLKLVILDACRNNPFVDTMTRSTGTRAIQKGLAKVEPDTSDTLVAYASKAGTVALDGSGSNSPFAEALSKYIAQPGVDIRIALGQVRDEVLQVTQKKQEPFVYGSLGGAQIFLSIKQLNVTITTGSGNDAKPGSGTAVSDAAQDWQNIKDLADKDLLQAFIAKHGSDPVYKMLAEKKLRQLAEAADKPDTSADRIAWDALKGSTDGAALNRFLERYPNSPLRAEVETALASLNKPETGEQSGTDIDPARKDCYLLAGEPQAVAGFSGVPLARIDPKRARTACSQAVNANAGDGLLSDLLGRAYEADRNYPQAKKYYQASADLGDMYGLTNLGWLAISGQEGPADYARARSYFEKAADAGNPVGQVALAYLYRDGVGVAQDYKAAARLYEKAAERGNAAAMANLGWLYREGLGVEKDYQKSADYYRRGAEAGDPTAIAGMGYAAQNGVGIPQNYDEAKSWYEKGANAGDAYSMASLAYLYDAGIGVKQDYIEARYWYEKASDAGSSYAMGNLARIYDQGLGVAVDPAEAAKWAIAAVEAGDANKLMELKSSPENFSPAFRRALQTELGRKGYYLGTATGTFDPATGEALDRASRHEKADEKQGKASGADAGTHGFALGKDRVPAFETIKFVPNKRSDSVAARRCYELAGQPGAEPGVAGFDFISMNSGEAIAACTKAAEADPSDSMIFVMLGRAYDAARQFEGAKENYLKALSMGNVYAYANIAWMVMYGNGTDADFERGFAMMKKVADTGNAFAQASVGWVYRDGFGGIPVNYETAFAWYEKAARQNYANADATLGWMYREGKGAERDYAKSFQYYRQAADQGDANGMGGVGYAYQEGLSVKADLALARQWFEKAAAKNDAYATGALGFLYRDGKGVKQDYGRALDYLRKAVDLGDSASLTALGYAYQYGTGVAADPVTAASYYERGAASGDAYASAMLGYMYREGVGVEKNLSRSLGYYRAGAEKGDLTAMSGLGYALQYGLGTPVDLGEARRWYEKAAEGGDGYSMGVLGWFAQTGLGVLQDYASARSYYEKAAKAGNFYAMGNLAYLLDAGLGGPRNIKEATQLAMTAVEAGDETVIATLKAGATDFSPGFRKEFQRRLSAKKVFKGKANGVFGSSTASAIDALKGKD